ncbi:phage tail sheath subtilisin-like domain-containing protein [Nocardia jinanensis]|nr:phage tail sheath subtilisin-like domain-containing protein [Nocardia jinanensis]
MPEYLAPGVYVEEISSGPPPIAGVGTTTTGMIGVTRRGPAEGPPTLVTSYAEFVRTFGGAFDFGPAFAEHRDLPDAVRGFFANGGRRIYISRVVPTSATAALGTLHGGVITRLASDALPEATTLTLATTRGLRVGSVLRLVMEKNGVEEDSANLTITDYDRDTGIVTITPELPADKTWEARYTRVLTNVKGVANNGQVSELGGTTSAKPDTFGLVASSQGSWGNQIRVGVDYKSAGRSVVRHTLMTTASPSIPVVSTAGFYPGAWVEVSFGTAEPQKVYRKVERVVDQALVLDGPDIAAGAWDPAAPITETRIATCEFDLTVSWSDPVEHTPVTERFTGLTLEKVPGRYYVDQLAGSALVQVDSTVADPAGTHPFFFPSPADGLADTLNTQGTDGTAAPIASDYRGKEVAPNDATGLLALEKVDEIALLAAPGVIDAAVQGALVEQATRLMDRFVVLDPPSSASLPIVQTYADKFDTRYAALYYPRVVVSDPVTGAPRVVAPSGHVLGIYARVDNTRGVHKAPANEVILGITGLEQTITKGQQEILNPRGINVLRDLRADRRGFRVYGARCRTSEQDWIYVNVRRLFIFLEESLDEGTQWVVFEPNDYRLWQRVKDSISIFLEGVWRDGALMGEKKEEAFFVTCDRSTMADDDILGGRFVVEIGICPVRPAEFVILRIGQWLGGSSVAEL